MLKRIKNVLIAVFVPFATILGANNAFADFTGMDSVMTISPPSQRVVLVPGEDYEGSISVSSSSTSKNDLEYSVTVESFSYAKDDEGKANYEDVDTETVTGYNQIIDWIELKKDKGVVAKGETDVVPFVIHVPENAPAGGQYATIIVQDDTEMRSTGDAGVVIESTIRFASNLIAYVTGETIDKGAILENNIPSFLLNNQLTTSSLVKNEGNVHTDAEYTLQVWPLFSDEEICTNEENKETSLIMPDTERYHNQTCNLPSVGIFKAKQTVSIFGETSIAERTIIVCPIWLLFLIMFGVIALVIWVVLKMRGGKRRSGSRDD